MKRHIAKIREGMLAAIAKADEKGLSADELFEAGSRAYPTASAASLGYALSALVSEGQLDGEGAMNHRRYHDGRKPRGGVIRTSAADRAEIYNTPPLRCAMQGPYIHRRVPSWESSQ